MAPIQLEQLDRAAAQRFLESAKPPELAVIAERQLYVARPCGFRIGLAGHCSRCCASCTDLKIGLCRRSRPARC